ncbi:MAG: hypothetical protein IT576_20825 [Verrucomicrobiales bacterium]|nr:hypothetical protein [Verrucomicrobiales bacterium]
MRKLLLGPTPDLHARQAARIRGSLRWSNIAILSILATVLALWVLHLISVIPPVLGGGGIPKELTAAFGKIQTPVPGATGFMIDANHFLTTQDALAGAGQEVKVADEATVSFPDSTGQLSAPAKGSISWISEDLSGVRLVLVTMETPHEATLPMVEGPLLDDQSYRIAGFQTTEDGKDFLFTLPIKLFIADGLGTVDWGDRDAPVAEGFPVLQRKDDGTIQVQGILSSGLIAVPLPLEDLKTQGVKH